MSIHIAKGKPDYQIHHLPKFYLQKNPDLTGFFIIKPSHPNGLKKNRSGWKKTGMGALTLIRCLFAYPICHVATSSNRLQLKANL